MKSMYIGSGDISAMMSGCQTKAFNKLLKRFVSNELPYYNAQNSPIDALRTGAILEDRYYRILENSYYPQYKVASKDMDVFKCSLDFAKLDKGNVVDFDELKSCEFTDFIQLQNQTTEAVLAKYKNYHNQLQQQLYCTDLESANLVFLAVYSYDDAKNRNRDIQPNEYIKFRVCRNEQIIENIKLRGLFFQQIKDHFTKLKQL